MKFNPGSSAESTPDPTETDTPPSIEGLIYRAGLLSLPEPTDSIEGVPSAGKKGHAIAFSDRSIKVNLRSWPIQIRPTVHASRGESFGSKYVQLDVFGRPFTNEAVRVGTDQNPKTFIIQEGSDSVEADLLVRKGDNPIDTFKATPEEFIEVDAYLDGCLAIQDERIAKYGQP